MKTTTNLDEFNSWVADMDDALERFFASISVDHLHLNFSPQSLSVLEAWELARYVSKDEMLKPGEAHNLDGIARYIGETFRKSAGGNWDINLNDPKDAFYGVPILTGFRTALCPLALATTAVDRRTGKFLRTLLENNLKRRVS